ncbi:MAG: (Fe-S)-binding protein [Desulfobacteraceae bacterium]
MFHPHDIIEILAGNVKQTKSPFGIPKFMANRWWKSQNLPKTGEYMLITGLMYQFTPFIDKSTRYLEAFEDTKWAKYLKYARYMPGYLSGMGLALITSLKAQKKAGKALEDIAGLLVKSGINFGYNPNIDNYSGILLYDLGDQEGFVAHADYVAKKLKKAGVHRIITVDPHTTYALKVLVPKYTGYQFDVTPYFELLDLKGEEKNLQVTLHDPCFYGRYLKTSKTPVSLLSGMGIKTSGIRNNGEFTNCCGGPAEAISPRLSHEIMEKRVEELKVPGKPIVAMCPICLGNLKKSGAEVEDLSALLARHAG